MWAVRYSVQETVAGGAQTVQISSAFTHQNFNGLVTFTNIDTQVAATSTITSLTSTVGTKVDATGATNAANTAISNSTVIASKVDAAGATTAANTAINNSSVIAGKVAKTDIYTTNTTTIDGGKITTGSINANTLNIGNNTGNSSSNRIVIDGATNTIKVYNGSQLRVVIGNLA
jgi:hypothetical protein